MSHIQPRHLRQQVGSINQRAFGGTPYARFDLLNENAQHEIARDRHNQEIAQQQAQANPHGWRLTL
ncbi:hypothetical protein D3C75_1243930 [compost metagenome]